MDLLRPKDYTNASTTAAAGDDDDEHDGNDPVNEGGGLSQRSFASEGRGGRGDVNDSLAIEGGEFLSTLIDNGDHSSRRGDHYDSAGGNERDDDDDSLVESIILPSDAARMCVDAFHDFVSALYHLQHCSDMPSPLIDAIVEYSPAVNAAFGRVKGPISELELEHDAMTYDSGSDDGEGRVAKLAAALSAVSARINAASEAVRVIAEEFGSNEYVWSGSKLGESIQDSKQVLGSSSLGHSFGGSTLGGGFGSSSAARHMVGSSSLGCSTSSTSSSGKSKKRLDQKAGRRFRLLECRLATCVEILSLSAAEAHRIDATGFDGVVEGVQQYVVRFKCLRAWRRAGRREEAHLIEAAAAMGASVSSRSPHVGGEGSAKTPPKSFSVSAELFLEVASLVLTATAPTGTDGSKNSNKAAKGGKRSSFASLPSVPEDALQDAPCLIDRIRQDGVAMAADALGGGNEVDVAEVLRRLGRIRAGMGEHAVALVHHKEAHSLVKSRLGDAHPRVASTLRLIGESYWKMGRKAAADKCYSEAADVLERPPVSSMNNSDRAGTTGESTSKDTVERAELLSSVFLSWSDLKLDMHDDVAALDILSRCSAAQLKAAAFASDDELASVAVSSALSDILYRRGSLCMGRHREDDALKDFDEVLRLRISSRGVDHPSVGDIAHVVGVLQSKRGNHYLALLLLEDVLRIRKKSMTTAAAAGAGAGAEAIRQRREGAAKAADSLVVIGNIHANTGNPANAVGVYDEALELRMEGLGKGDERVADVHVNLGHALYDMRRYDDAAGHYWAGLTVIEKARGWSDGRVPRLLGFLGKAQYRAGRLRMATTTFEELANYHKTPAAEEDEFDSKSGAEARRGGAEYAEAKRMVDTIEAEIARTWARGASSASSAAPAAVVTPVISRREQQKRQMSASSKSEGQSASPRWITLFGRGEKVAKVSADDTK